MPPSMQPLRAWPGARPVAVGVLLALAGSALWVQREHAERREAFDTDARIAHRLLSQVAVQHDAMLATLTLLQPPLAEGAGAAPEQRLPALVPQVLQVLRRERGQPWPAPLAAAAADSQRLQRAVLAQAELGQGRYTVLRAGEPTGFALVIDATRLVPWAEWPLPREGPVAVRLRLGDQALALQPGAGAGGGWGTLRFAKPLAAESQPFVIELQRSLRWAELPWGRLLLWWGLCAAGVWAFVAWQRQRDAARRAEELLRLGQVGRLNALGELAAGMAHELNQPLTAVLAGTQAAQRLLAEEDPDLTTARQALQHSAEQARRAADVVGRLRRLVQPPDPSAALQPLALADTARNVLYLLAPQLQAAGVQVDSHGLADGPQVRADPVALEQIVHNLVLNALQALQQVPAAQRRLQLQAVHEDGQARLRVHDSGPGFSAAALARAFEPFFSTREGGLGLGLSLCESLAAGMGGSLRASNHPQGGAELVLGLPAMS